MEYDGTLYEQLIARNDVSRLLQAADPTLMNDPVVVTLLRLLCTLPAVTVTQWQLESLVQQRDRRAAMNMATVDVMNAYAQREMVTASIKKHMAFEAEKRRLMNAPPSPLILDGRE